VSTSGATNGGRGAAARGRRSASATCLAVAFFAAATALAFAGVWRTSIFDVIAIATRSEPADPGPDWQSIVAADATLATWLVARNAYTLTHSPSHLFDSERCAPAANTLAFGEPVITLGVLGIPASVLTRDPIATYNLAVFSTFFLSAVAMYVLMVDWTRSRPAAVIAAILYAFGSERLASVTHIFIFDTLWVLFALYFFGRWLEHGRWRDALGLVVSVCLQLGTSLYPILASVLATLPIAFAIAARRGLSRIRATQALCVLLGVAVATYVIFSPVLTLRANSEILRRTEQHFAPWSWFLPGGVAGVTWTAAVLALAALWPQARVRDVSVRTLRWPVVAGALLAAAMAVGLFYPALSAVLPGLDVVRVPARIDTGYHLAMCLLAGLGAAALIHGFPRSATVLSAVLIAAAAVETVAASVVGGPVSTLRVAPAADDVELFRKLEAMGNTGPLLEIPLGDRNHEFVFQSPPRLLLSAYHHRRTSACYASFFPPGREELRRDALILPERAAVARLCASGFTTVIVHLASPRGQRAAEQLQAAGRDEHGSVRYLVANSSMAAFALVCDTADVSGARSAS
jgi:hypothetical protein